LPSRVVENRPPAADEQAGLLKPPGEAEVESELALPLAGVRVIDVGTRISAPFCAGVLGEMGAEVIKVELPGTGDFMRHMGPFVESEEGPYSLSWAVEGRGRKGVTCDLRRPEGQDLFRRLAAVSDVVCENFRPGTMEGWGLGPDSLAPHLVYVRISVFGQSGPYSRRPGLDRMGIAYGGLLHLTGEPDRPPVRPGVNVSDYLTGVFAAAAAAAALFERASQSDPSAFGGRVVDAPLYGSVLRIMEWTLAGYDRLGVVRQREGNRLSTSAPLDNFPTADGAWVAIVAGSDANFARLCRAMGRVDLLSDPRFASVQDRAAHGEEINAIVADWTGSLPAEVVMERCLANDVPVARAYSSEDIFSDPHMAERGDLVTVDDPVIGPVRQQAPYPRIDYLPTSVPSGAPRLGQHNKEVWCSLVGVSSEELAELEKEGVV
jgi:formyl-CoA transferase